MRKNCPICLSIAGSDSSGGAGIQADLKTFSALGCYGASVITAVTSQNTRGVIDVHPIPEDIVSSQIEAVLSDFETVNVKIGMVANTANARAIVRSLQKYPSHIKTITYDPVMASTSGRPLLCHETIPFIKKYLFPLCTLVTPNIDEAQLLFDCKLSSSSIESIKKDLIPLCVKEETTILIKGGHMSDENKAIDILVSPQGVNTYTAPKIKTSNTHGTGCTLSSAICAFMACGLNLEEAISYAKTYLTHALIAGKSLQIGQGIGPVNHFFAPMPLIVREIP